ncbi:MAG: peptidoglycan DD-metalloendopeptidase family protein [Planctomycetaceae bacterium]|nr:peptidoglycan DD-metalloendopeptidase family protein [Planctomycetaceae bacterium]
MDTIAPLPRRRPDYWPYVVLTFLVLQGMLYVIPHQRPGLAGAVCWLLGSDSGLWLIVTAGLALIALVACLRRRPVWNRWRAVGFAGLAALVLSPMAFRVYPSSHENRPSQVPFRLPFDGPITVGWGGDTPDVNYHVCAADQRWAYDLLVTQDGETHRGDGTKVEDYYCYGLPVLAPADGVVESFWDKDPDMAIGELGGGTDPGGNHIVLKVASREYLFLCHLQPGSLKVKPGDNVTAGQVVAAIGNSGNTSEPHLHIHLQDTPDSTLGEGIPLYFHQYRVGDRLIDRGMPTGGITAEGFIGQIVEDAGPSVESNEADDRP